MLKVSILARPHWTGARQILREWIGDNAGFNPRPSALDGRSATETSSRSCGGFQSSPVRIGRALLLELLNEVQLLKFQSSPVRIGRALPGG